MLLHEEKELTKKQLVRLLYFPFLFIALLWGIELVQITEGFRLSEYGVYPRTLKGLKGILFYPLVHGDVQHLVNNTAPLLVLLLGLFYFYRKMAWQILGWAWFMSAVWIWVAARPSYHIGASGVIYALGSFIFFSGVFRKYGKLLALSLVVVFLYGGMVWGIFPTKPGISWEGHLFGAVAGLILAYQYRKEGPQRKKFKWEEEDDEEEDSPEIPEELWKYGHLPKPPPQITYHYKEKKEK